MSKQTFRHTLTPRASLSQTQELQPNVIELWVYLAHGSPYFFTFKWKEWEKSEQCLNKEEKEEKRNAARGFAVGLGELAKSQEK